MSLNDPGSPSRAPWWQSVPPTLIAGILGMFGTILLALLGSWAFALNTEVRLLRHDLDTEIIDRSRLDAESKAVRDRTIQELDYQRQLMQRHLDEDRANFNAIHGRLEILSPRSGLSRERSE